MLPGREVQGTGDLFVEEDVAHRVQNVRVEAGKTRRCSARRVRIENLVEALGIIRRGITILPSLNSRRTFSNFVPSKSWAY
jgi:hypothetical protein